MATAYRSRGADAGSLDRSPSPAHRPGVVFHSDWSMHAHKRRQAQAVLDPDGRYLAFAPQPTLALDRVLAELREHAPPTGSVLAGFDFAIGLPSAYATRVGVSDFLKLLRRLGSDEWGEFFRVATSASEISLHRPFYPQRAERKGSATQAQLCAALGVASMDELRRRCDRGTPTRKPAEVMFWTLGAKQVGKGVISGWKEMLQPAMRSLGKDVRLWPFEGALTHLLAPGRVVVVETYPAECYGHFGLNVSKRNQPSRREAGRALLRWAGRAGVRATSDLEHQLLDGFGPASAGEDDFDAAVGLFGILNVVLGRRVSGEPADGVTRRVEGWMFGMV